MAAPLTIPITGGSVAAGSSLGASLGGIGSFLGGLGSLAGAFGGGNKDKYATNKMLLAEHQQRFAENAYWNQVRHRVYDTKRAGLHPLYATGQPTLNQPTIPITGQSRTGGRAADALRATGEAMMAYENHKQALAESKARTYKDLKQAEMFDAEALSTLRQSQANPQNDIGFSHVPVRDPWSGDVYWEANKDYYELPETLGAAKAAEGRVKYHTKGSPSHYRY